MSDMSRTPSLGDSSTKNYNFLSTDNKLNNKQHVKVWQLEICNVFHTKKNTKVLTLTQKGHQSNLYIKFIRLNGLLKFLLLAFFSPFFDTPIKPGGEII